MCGDQVNRSDESGLVGDETAEVFSEETVDGVPVLTEVRVIETAPGGLLPAVQTAVAVATGFVAGAAMLALVRRHGARRLERARRSRRGSESLSIVGSRSFLIDVHLIGKPGE